MKIVNIFKFMALALLVTSCTFSTPAKGSKIGRIVKISEEGVFYKTVEGELIRGGLLDGNGSMGSSFKFTIEDDSLKDIAYDAFSNQKEVIITYESELISSLFRSQCGSPHFVKDIKINR